MKEIKEVKNYGLKLDLIIDNGDWSCDENNKIVFVEFTLPSGKKVKIEGKDLEVLKSVVAIKL